MPPISSTRTFFDRVFVPAEISTKYVSIATLNTVDNFMRMNHHKMVLELLGVTDVATLPKLQIAGNVIPQPGLLVQTQGASILGASKVFNSARIIRGGLKHKVGGTAYLLKTKIYTPPRFVHPETITVPLNVAYWAGSEIEIADNTTIILKQPNRYLVIITPKLTVGQNVTITWERNDKGLPLKPSKPPTPDKAATPNGLWGQRGAPGIPGATGGRGWFGDPGPEIEVWTLEMSGVPAVDVAGQDGFQGGPGGDGGDGGEGADGRAWISALGGLACDSGPGSGGDGGPGGRAGDGGPGGDGGHGGSFFLFAPQQVLNSYTNSFYVDVAGGSAGSGGIPGTPGDGGAGGARGQDRGGRLGGCPTSSPRTAGSAGPMGASGNPGIPGLPGGHYPDALSLKPITEADFNLAYTKPAIVGFDVQVARKGDTIKVYGLRFSNTDVVVIQNVSCQTTFVSQTELSFVVASVQGGRVPVQVKQADGTLSNRGTLVICPTVQYAEQDGKRSDDADPALFRPGTMATLVGDGFAPNATVKVLDQYVSGADVQFISPTTLRFKVIRPVSTPRQVDGEPVSLSVILSEGNISDVTSNEITILLDTYLMLVFGDSIQWGQGLREEEKFHTLIENEIRNVKSNMSVYKLVFAHSGATIGVGDNTQMSPVDGEVPTSYPTILQQIQAFAGNPNAVDLILIDGGINDVSVNEIVSPFADSDLVALVNQHCYNDMKELLKEVTKNFKNAKIIVTGYYQIVSAESDLSALTAMLVVLGLVAGAAVGGAVGGVVGGVIGAVISVTERDKMVRRSAIFATEAEKKLALAVQETNINLGTPRVCFANPAFGPANAIFASDPWIYGINWDLSPEDNPPTGVAPTRSDACETAGSSRTNVDICKRASMGHPNVLGAKEYARVIREMLP